MKSVAKPCPACPFTRTVTPGALGGSMPQAFVGQARGPFTLPCHQHCDFDNPAWRSKATQTPQCAGAATFRGHIGLTGKLPPAIPILPANGQVFLDEYEFLAHHMRLSVEEVKHRYSLADLDDMLRDQLRKAYTGEKP